MRGKNYAEGALMLVGSYIPFAATAAERKKTDDPRLSLEERYGNHAEYVEAVRAAANNLKEQRLLLEEDVERYVAKAKASDIGK